MRAPIPSLHHHVPRSRNLQSDHPSPPRKPREGKNPTVRRAGRRFSFGLSLQFCSGTSGGATSAIPSVSGHHLPVPNVNETKPARLSSPTVGPTVAYENKPDLKSSPPTSAGPVIHVVDEPSDALTPPKTAADETEPVKLSGPTVDLTVVYGDKPGWKSTLHASAGLVIDVVKESSDAFAPLKSVAGVLSAILKHYDVCHVYSSKPCTPLTSEPANDGEP